MKQRLLTVLTLALILALTVALQLTQLRNANAQERNINVNEALDLNGLGIKNEVQRINSPLDAQARFFKRATELKRKGILSPRDPASFREEANLRKADLLTLQREFETLINKLKQRNHWNETFDAQALASLKNINARTVVSQLGGARKVLQAAVEAGPALRADIDDEVRRVEGGSVGALRNRGDRVFAAHASPPIGKLGCNVLLGYWFTASLVPGAESVACFLADRYNDKGCTPRLNVDC